MAASPAVTWLLAPLHLAVQTVLWTFARPLGLGRPIGIPSSGDGTRGTLPVPSVCLPRPPAAFSWRGSELVNLDNRIGSELDRYVIVYNAADPVLRSALGPLPVNEPAVAERFGRTRDRLGIQDLRPIDLSCSAEEMRCCHGGRS